MTPETLIYLVAGGASGLLCVGLLAWVRRNATGDRGIFGFVAGVMGLAAVVYVLTAYGIGTIQIGDASLLLPLLVNDLVAYPGFFVIAGLLAGASRAQLLALGGVSVIQRLAFEVASVGVFDGVLALLGPVVVVVGWFVHVYLFVGPVWASAADVSARRRLVHWKCRNLLLFLVGMLIVFGVLILAGVMDFFVVSLTNAYISFLVRAGVAGFVFANAGAITGAVGDGSADAATATGAPAGD